MERLDQIVVRAGAEAFAAVLRLVLAEEQDHRRVGGGAFLLAQPRRDGEAVDPWQAGRDQDQGRLLRARDSQRLGTLCGGYDRVARLGEGIAERPLHCRVGVYYEDPDGHQLTWL